MPGAGDDPDYVETTLRFANVAGLWRLGWLWARQTKFKSEDKCQSKIMEASRFAVTFDRAGRRYLILRRMFCPYMRVVQAFLESYKIQFALQVVIFGKFSTGF